MGGGGGVVHHCGKFTIVRITSEVRILSEPRTNCTVTSCIDHFMEKVDRYLHFDSFCVCTDGPCQGYQFFAGREIWASYSGVPDDSVCRLVCSSWCLERPYYHLTYFILSQYNTYHLMSVKLHYQAPANLEITITGGLQRPVQFQESFHHQYLALILRITVDHRRPLQGKFM